MVLGFKGYLKFKLHTKAKVYLGELSYSREELI